MTGRINLVNSSEAEVGTESNPLVIKQPTSGGVLATEAKQDIGNASLASIDSKTPTLIDGRQPSLSMDYGLAVSRGLISGVTTKSITGYNAAASTTLEPIWSTSTATYPWPTAAVTAQIASSSVNDTGTGTGARTVLVNYLTTSFVDTNVIVTLSGTTPVNIADDVFRVNQVVCLTWGTGLSNAGNLWIGYGGGFAAATGFTSNLSKIEIGENISQQAIYTVPATKVLEGLSYRIAQSAPCRFRLQYKTSSSAGYLTAFNLPLDASVAFTSPFASSFAAGTDIIVQAQAITGTPQVGIIISGFLRSV